MNLRDLKEKRANAQKQIDAILYTGEGDARAAKATLTTEERTQHDNLVSEYDALNDTITRLEAAEARSAAAAKPAAQHKGGEAGEVSRMAKRFSLAAAVRQLDKGKFDGVEAEVRSMAVEENGERPIEGIGIPSKLMRLHKTDGTQYRGYLDVATEGADVVSTTIASDILPVLRPQVLIADLGVNVLTGLRNNLQQAKATTGISVTWEGENDVTAETLPVFAALNMSPNRLAAHTPISRQILLQSTPDVEAFVRQDIERAISYAIDLAALYNGPAADDTGVFQALGTGETVAMGTNGGVPTFASMLAMEKLIDTANAAALGPISILTTPGIKSLFKNTKIDSGSGIMVWSDNEINGYRAISTNYMPSTLTKGSTSGTCHAILMGAFNQLVVGQFGALDIIMDPYTLAKNGAIQLVVNSYWDVMVRYPKAFAKIADATLS